MSTGFHVTIENSVVVGSLIDLQRSAVIAMLILCVLVLIDPRLKACAKTIDRRRDEVVIHKTSNKLAESQSTEKHDQPCRSRSSEEKRAGTGGTTDGVAFLVCLHVDLVQSMKRACSKAERIPHGEAVRDRPTSNKG
jgi:hypothetical protein